MLRLAGARPGIPRAARRETQGHRDIRRVACAAPHCRCPLVGEVGERERKCPTWAAFVLVPVGPVWGPRPRGDAEWRAAVGSLAGAARSGWVIKTEHIASDDQSTADLRSDIDR
jgi:hypothetical protein